MTSSFSSDDCHILAVPKPRAGKSRYWCFSHDASATARFGGRMPRCEGAYRTIAHYRRFCLDPDDFSGGVAIWGAVEPVYNTAVEPAERGIHVHARKRARGKKDIDETFDAVELTVRRDLFNQERVLITAETAVAYYISRFLGRVIVGLFCPNCGTPHLDSDWFAVKPHRVHLCHGCNKLFQEEQKRVSNPLEMVRHQLSAIRPAAKPTRAKGSIDISQSDYPAGLQIWASNPALLLTSPRSEQEGIHVHGWIKPGVKPKLDGTFDSVRIDGIELNEAQLRLYMAQNALVYMKGKIACLECPSCGEELFEQGEAAFRPKVEHKCGTCGMAFASPGRRKVVSNPFVATIKALKATKRKKG
ncbi:hypothetical protein GCM10023219_20380 [Stakelama sediminis]|uniref:Putative RNA-binding Zn-ribbon protein involved in translation (DUF1610 family) n=1 Tax=Stakelama sediminis TaxID=463200 RepID=A0A840Z3M6_9SPHN|nr:hypothetical protein [Stakelama sediminis]MBB5720242.1 putative RNA-binding Zn-ribbon protein involved in translation (DUF1610 family) [Stakelama sediminis]